MELNKRQISHLEKSFFFKREFKRSDSTKRGLKPAERAGSSESVQLQIKLHGRVFVLCTCLIRLKLHLEMKHLPGG